MLTGPRSTIRTLFMSAAYPHTQGAGSSFVDASHAARIHPHEPRSATPLVLLDISRSGEYNLLTISNDKQHLTLEFLLCFVIVLRTFSAPCAQPRPSHPPQPRQTTAVQPPNCRIRMQYPASWPASPQGLSPSKAIRTESGVLEQKSPNRNPARVLELENYLHLDDTPPHGMQWIHLVSTIPLTDNSQVTVAMKHVFMQRSPHANRGAAEPKDSHPSHKKKVNRDTFDAAYFHRDVCIRKPWETRSQGTAWNVRFSDLKPTLLLGS